MMKEPIVKLDADEWEKGYQAGLTGKPGLPPHGLAYASGLIEGKADKAKPPEERKPHKKPSEASS